MSRRPASRIAALLRGRGRPEGPPADPVSERMSRIAATQSVGEIDRRSKRLISILVHLPSGPLRDRLLREHHAMGRARILSLMPKRYRDLHDKST